MDEQTKDQQEVSETDLNMMVFPTLAAIMPTTGAPSPRLARILEVDLAIGNGRKRPVELVYTRSLDFAVTGFADFKIKMQAYVTDSNSHGKPASPRDNDTTGKPIGTKMSIRWRDQNNAANGIRYLVIRLANGIDWAFFDPKGAALPPFTMQADEARKNMFFQGGKFRPDGTHIEATADEPECQYAYFIVNGPNLANAGQTDYIRRFNIHIDLLERDARNVIINRIPIIVDPDVRNPGGGGSD